MTDSYDFMTDVDVVQKPAAKKRGRIWELDFIRGFLILLMLIDHLLMTVDYFMGRNGCACRTARQTDSQGFTPRRNFI